VAFTDWAGAAAALAAARAATMDLSALPPLTSIQPGVYNPEPVSLPIQRACQHAEWVEYPHDASEVLYTDSSGYPHVAAEVLYADSPPFGHATAEVLYADSSDFCRGSVEDPMLAGLAERTHYPSTPESTPDPSMVADFPPTPEGVLPGESPLFRGFEGVLQDPPPEPQIPEAVVSAGALTAFLRRPEQLAPLDAAVAACMADGGLIALEIDPAPPPNMQICFALMEPALNFVLHFSDRNVPGGDNGLDVVPSSVRSLLEDPGSQKVMFESVCKLRLATKLWGIRIQGLIAEARPSTDMRGGLHALLKRVGLADGRKLRCTFFDQWGKRNQIKWSHQHQNAWNALRLHQYNQHGAVHARAREECPQPCIVCPDPDGEGPQVMRPPPGLKKQGKPHPGCPRKRLPKLLQKLITGKVRPEEDIIFRDWIVSTQQSGMHMSGISFPNLESSHVLFGKEFCGAPHRKKDKAQMSAAEEALRQLEKALGRPDHGFVLAKPARSHLLRPSC